ncbi:unnamed protein product [Acanthoscelides obtectus]|uniref:Uncharacterized protein n=1 Tax=Acanthoscelides obtectus TaxID=200917 RepID=A0A9P0PLR3_ACAOB|nr:unnamed protein product [Acanthoscelides obtectus]CAK1671750.1 hypothetical protein AOBTE_LOCUS28434 [Acanthoscelides obtectus]
MDVNVDDDDDDDEYNDTFFKPEDTPFMSQYPEIAREPVQKFWSKSNTIDLVYGPTYDSVAPQWRIGSKH